MLATKGVTHSVQDTTKLRRKNWLTMEVIGKIFKTVIKEDKNKAGCGSKCIPQFLEVKYPCHIKPMRVKPTTLKSHLRNQLI